MEIDAVTKALVVVSLLLLAPVARAAEPVPLGGSCSGDNQCVLGAVCVEGACRPVAHNRNILPFYWHQAGPEGHRVILPLVYFHTWSREHDTRVQFPLFVQRTDKKEQRVTTVVPLALYSHQRTPTYSSHSVWPLFFYRGGSQRVVALPLLLSGGQRDDVNDVSEAVVALLGYYRRHHDDTWRMLLPLFVDHQTAKTRTTIGPLSYFRRTETTRSDVVFPIVWHHKNLKTGRDTTVVLPLFEHSVSEHGRRAQLVSIFGTYQRDDDAQLKQLALLLPTVYYRRDLLRNVDVVAPLFTRWKVHADGSSGFIAGPLYRTADLHGSTTSLLPLYWRFHDRDRDATTHLLLPVAGFHHRPGTFGGYLGPLYAWRSSPPALAHAPRPVSGWGVGVAPLLFFGRSGERSHALVLPLFAHLRDRAARSSLTAVGPLFYRTTSDGWDAGALPLVYGGRHGDRTYGNLVPLYWHRGDARGATDVLGPLYLHHGKDGYGFGLVPLAFFRNVDGELSQVVPPLFWRFKSTRGQTERMLLGPWFSRRDGDERADVVLPLLYYRRSPREALLVSPLGGWKRDDSTGRSTLVVGPYVRLRDQKRDSTTHVLPLVVVHRSPNYRVTVQFPFFWRVHEGPVVSTVLFPLYWRQRGPERSTDVVLPLFARFRSPKSTTTAVGPAYYYAGSDGGRAVGLAPLFLYGRRPNDGRPSSYFTLLPPLVFYSRNQQADTARMWVGPLFHFHNAQGYTDGLVPLVFAWRRGTVSRVLAPLFYRRSDAATGTSLTVAGLAYSVKRAHDRSMGLFPLLFIHRADDGNASTTVLPLLRHTRRPDGSSLYSLAAGYSTYGGGYLFYLGPFYVRRDREISSTALWPFIYHTRNHAQHSSTTLVAPLYYHRAVGDGSELSAYTPLVWRRHTVEGSTIFGLPLYFDAHAYHESRTTGVMPFAVVNRNYVDHNTSVVVPPLLLWARARRGTDPGNDAVMFPLLWRFGGKNPTTVLFPLVWSFQRPSVQVTVVAPFTARWHVADGDHTIVLNTYYRKGRGPREGTYYLNVVPFFDVGRPRKQDFEWNVLEGLFGYSRQGRNRMIRFLWLLDVPIDPVGTQMTGWFGSTPPSARTEF